MATSEKMFLKNSEIKRVHTYKIPSLKSLIENVFDTNPPISQ